MKKYVWLLIAAAFAVAVLAMVGCRPAETPAASPSPSPTVAPTPDTRCPQPVSTVVRSLYDPISGAGTAGEFEIVITFDEPIAGDMECLENPSYWTVTVSNDTREGDVTATVEEVTVEGNKITIKGNAIEDENGFQGLICSKEDAEWYEEVTEVNANTLAADVVEWRLSSLCSIYDELGNPCCGGSDKTCCSVVCPGPTPTPTPGCPLL